MGKSVWFCVLTALGSFCLAHGLPAQIETLGTHGPKSQARQDFEKADARLNAAYKQLTTTLDKKRGGALRDEQRTWLASRDATATAQARQTLAPGANLQDALLESAAHLTDERATVIEQRARESGAPPAPAPPGAPAPNPDPLVSADAHLNAVYGKLVHRLPRPAQKTLADEQRGWLDARKLLAPPPRRGQPPDPAKLADAAALTETRAGELEKRLAALGPEAPPPGAPAADNGPLSAPPPDESGQGPQGLYLGELPFGDGTRPVELAVSLEGRQQATASLRVSPPGGAAYVLAYHGRFLSDELSLDPDGMNRDTAPQYPSADRGRLRLAFKPLDFELVEEHNSNRPPAFRLVRNDEAARRKSKPAAVADAAPAAFDPTDPTGVYTGTFTADQAITNFELKIGYALGAKTIEGVITYFAPGGNAAAPQGGAELAGTFDPQTKLLELTATKHLRNGGNLSVDGVKATVDLASGRIVGKVLPNSVDGLELARDEAKSLQLQTARRAMQRGYDAAPLSYYEARGDDQRAAVLLRWGDRLWKEYPGLNLGSMQVGEGLLKTTNLFRDDTFVPVFGKPLEQMPQEERRRIGMQIESFSRAPQYANRFSKLYYICGSLINPQQSDALAAAVAFRRVKAKEYRSLLDEAQGLPATRDAFKRAVEIGATQENLKPAEADVLWPSERTALRDAAHAAQARIAGPLLTAQCDAALAKATDYPGLLALRQTLNESDDLLAAVAPETRDRELKRAGDAIHARLPELMADETRKVDAIPHGPQAARAGAAWYQDFSKRYNLFHDPCLAAVVDHLAQRRAQDLADAEPEIKAAQANNTLEALAAALLVVPSDEKTATAGRIRKFQADRAEERVWEAQKSHYSEREIALMVSHGVIKVPEKCPPPTGREVALAVLRAFAQSGKGFRSPDTVEYVRNPAMDKLLHSNMSTFYVQISHVDVAQTVLAGDGGYECSCRIFISFEQPFFSQSHDAFTQAVSGPFGGKIGNKEPPYTRVKMNLTPSGWRSSNWDAAVASGALEDAMQEFPPQ